MDGGSKNKLFKFIQKTYQDIGLDSPKSNQNRSPINTKNWILLFCLAQYFGSTAAYILFEANSMIGFGMALFCSSCIDFGFILYLILQWQMENILSYIDNCERFIEKRKHSAIIYQDANEKIERFTEYLAYALTGSTIILLLLAFLYTIVNYYILDAGEESFFLFIPIWMPFDWKTPIGYLMAWLGQCAGSAAVTIIYITFFDIVFGSCWLFIVMAEDITSDVAAFNNTVGTQKDESAAKLMERHCEIIQIHSDAKQCVNEFNEICEYSLFAFFSWNMLAVSSILVTLQFQLWDDDSQPLEISILSMINLWVFVLNLINCEPGQSVTNQFEQFGVKFDQCEWHKLPIKVQRIYLIFLSDTQQPINIRCYGGIKCTRDTFKEITANGFSYFMTLRRFRA